MVCLVQPADELPEIGAAQLAEDPGYDADPDADAATELEPYAGYEEDPDTGAGTELEETTGTEDPDAGPTIELVADGTEYDAGAALDETAAPDDGAAEEDAAAAELEPPYAVELTGALPPIGS